MKKYIVLLVLLCADIALFFLMRNLTSFWTMTAFAGFCWLTLSEKLKACFPTEPEFITLQGVVHNGIFSNKKTLNSIQDFLESIPFNSEPST